MAFDSIFQGPPRDVAAPGTAQSPSLGVDVVNKQLYLSFGEGWQEVETSGEITGDLTTGYVPVASGAGSLEDSTIDAGITNPGCLTVQDGGSTSGVVVWATGANGLQLGAVGQIEIYSETEAIAFYSTINSTSGIQSSSATDNAGTITLVGGTGTYTFQNGPSSGAWAHPPVVIVRDITSAANDVHTVLTVTGSSITITNSVGTTDTYNFIAWPSS